MVIWFFSRNGDSNTPSGITASKNGELPEGDFGITEYCWGPVSLWFVNSDNFTDDERQIAYEEYCYEVGIL